MTITPSLLLFTYACVATPFLVWTVFRYAGIKNQNVYFQSIELKQAEQSRQIKEVFLAIEKMLNEINTIKLKSGFDGNKKSFLQKDR